MTAMLDLFDVSTHQLQLKLHENEPSSPPTPYSSKKATRLQLK
jgi:hypothetical protein